MSYATPEEWGRVREALLSAFDRVEGERLLSAWASSRARTKLYSKEVIPRVAIDLGLLHRSEFLSIDYVLEDENSQTRIFIESENEFWRVSARGEELEKLCSCRGEAGVLLTVAEWDEVPGIGWKSQRAGCLPKWLSCVARRTAGSTGQLIVVEVAELRDKRFRLYEEVLMGPGTSPTVGAPTVVYERHLLGDAA